MITFRDMKEKWWKSLSSFRFLPFFHFAPFLHSYKHRQKFFPFFSNIFFSLPSISRFTHFRNKFSLSKVSFHNNIKLISLTLLRRLYFQHTSLSTHTRVKKGENEELTRETTINFPKSLNFNLLSLAFVFSLSVHNSFFTSYIYFFFSSPFSTVLLLGLMMMLAS